jgi:hypothetical protein
VVYFFTSIISIFVDKIVRLTITPLASGLLGAVVGVIKGVLVCGILMSGAQVFMKPGEPFFTTSKIWPFLRPVTAQAVAWMPEGLQRTLSAKASADPRPGRFRTGAAPAASRENLPPEAVDWKNIQDILRNNPEAVLPAWREKLQSLSGGEALSPDDLKRFISDHPFLFSQAPLPPGQKPAAIPGEPPPTWPQPAAAE